MARSRKLGHCVCNPQHPCPCPTLLEQNVCPCAGERPLGKAQGVALTRHVRKAGCSSKIGQADLLEILSGLPPVTDPNVLVGAAAGDDAGVYRLDNGLALVQTVDVFTPCVDDPHLFGQVAAANSVSDVYAMGGRPLTALSVVGFPIDTLDGSIMTEMLRGGMEKLEEAGCALLGGHSINDEEIKCGFAITGVLDSTAAVERDRAEPGDVLVLTKPLGTGMISFAAQLGRVAPACLDKAGQWMAALNKDAAELMREHGAHACTDVTGFGLAGHLVAMARGSGVDVEIDLAALPVFGTAAACLEAGVYGGAVDRNQAYVMRSVRADEGAEAALPILYDPQTSGGLLIALPEKQAHAFVDAMARRGHEAVSIIGRVLEKTAGLGESEIRVTGAAFERQFEPLEPLTDPVAAPDSTATACCDSPPVVSCCDNPPAIAPSAPAAAPESKGNAMDTLDKFKDFMKEANQPGLIDQRNKKLMAVTLAIAYHCHPCLSAHLSGALEMGLSKEELDEAANLAISFGGCTAMMFYKEVCEELGL